VAIWAGSLGVKELSRRLNSTILNVVERHAEEAAIVWRRRDRAVGEPQFGLNDLARVDDQLEAHIDGLRIADEDASKQTWSVCERELRWQQPGEVFAAAIRAWESGKKQRIQRVTKAAAHCYDCSRALVSSLGWLGDERANPQIDRLLAGSNLFSRRIAIAACAVRGRDPGESLQIAVASRDKLLKARALRAIGELARQDLLPAARQGLRSRDARIRFSAAWSFARLENDESACRALQATVHSGGADQEPALQLAVRRLEPSAAGKWLNQLQLSQDASFIRQAVIGTGALGLPDAASWLLKMMAIPALARVAGEAFTMITGMNLVEARMEGPWPAGFTAGPTEDPADDNVALDPDENLPWPDASKIAAWWQMHRGDFLLGDRHLCGRPITEDWLEHVLRHGYQRQRAAAALELALLHPDQPLFNVRAPGHRQQKLLAWLSIRAARAPLS
jgi:uncharacterized protein (TIGR02270 family)